MRQTSQITIPSQIVEEEIELTLVELCHVCDVQEELVSTWIQEGLLEPRGQQSEEWRFDAIAFKRARLAARLSHDLEINPAGIALALDLIDEIAELKAEIRRGNVR